MVLEWIAEVIEPPERDMVQTDGRIRSWARIDKAGGKYLRVVLLEDGETIHNDFLIETISHENKIFPGH